MNSLKNSNTFFTSWESFWEGWRGDEERYLTRRAPDSGFCAGVGSQKERSQALETGLRACVCKYTARHTTRQASAWKKRRRSSRKWLRQRDDDDGCSVTEPSSDECYSLGRRQPLQRVQRRCWRPVIDPDCPGMEPDPLANRITGLFKRRWTLLPPPPCFGSPTLFAVSVASSDEFLCSDATNTSRRKGRGGRYLRNKICLWKTERVWQRRKSTGRRRRGQDPNNEHM